MNAFEEESSKLESDSFTGETTQENVIEFLRNAGMATIQFCQGRYISKIKKLASDYPDECVIVVENSDGSIVAHVPVKWIKISPTRKISEEQRAKAGERLKKYHENKIK